MTETVPILEGYATGSEIGPIIERVESVLHDVPRVHAMIALTSIVLLLQHPDITTDQIYEGVRDVSRFICLWPAGVEAETASTDKLLMN
jgi:hypothetical protein